jgi:hypothetical protein
MEGTERDRDTLSRAIEETLCMNNCYELKDPLPAAFAFPSLSSLISEGRRERQGYLIWQVNCISESQAFGILKVTLIRFPP